MLSGTDCLVQRAYNIRASPVLLTKTTTSGASDDMSTGTGAKVEVPLVAI